MVIEIPSRYLDNLLVFHRLYKIVSSFQRGREIILFINTSRSEFDLQKLTFLNSVLNRLGINVLMIIDRYIPNFYECILFESKLVGKRRAELNLVDIEGYIDYLTCKLLQDMFPGKSMFFSNNEFANRYSDLPVCIGQFTDITKIASSYENIKILKEIVWTLTGKKDNYVDNYHKLKDDLIDILSQTNSVPICDISNSVDIYPILSRKVNFRA